MPERPLPYRPPEIEGFDEVKPSRVERGRRGERKRHDQDQPVPSRAVHRRGQTVETVSEQGTETKEVKRLKELQLLIADRYERCSRFVGFIEANNYELSENFSETLIKDFHDGNDIVRRYLSEPDKASTENSDFVSDMIKIEGLMSDFESRFVELQSNISALESEEAGLVVPDEIKALFEESRPKVQADAGASAEHASKQEAISFEEKIDVVESKMKEYAALRKRLIAQIGTKEYEKFIQERLASESKDGAEFSERLGTAKDLVRRWDVLGAEFGFKELKEEMKKDGQGGIPYTKAVQDWFESKKDETDWKGADRRDLIDRMIPDMEALLVRAEAAATRLRVEAAARANVTVLATGRKIENDDQMTSWEKVEARKREAFIRELSTKEKDGYRRSLAQKLTQMGITDRLKRDQLGKQAFENFMPARIQQLAKQSQFELTAEEVETLMVNLRKEFLVP